MGPIGIIPDDASTATLCDKQSAGACGGIRIYLRGSHKHPFVIAIVINVGAVSGSSAINSSVRTGGMEGLAIRRMVS
jgi:hypothetical protein